MPTRLPSLRWPWCLAVALCLAVGSTPAGAKPPDLPQPTDYDFAPGNGKATMPDASPGAGVRIRSTEMLVPADLFEEEEPAPRGMSPADRCSALRVVSRCVLFGVNPLVPFLRTDRYLDFDDTPDAPILNIGDREVAVGGGLRDLAVIFCSGPFSPFYYHLREMQAPRPPIALADEEDEDEPIECVPLRGGAIIEGVLPKPGQEESSEPPPSSMGPCVPPRDKDFCPQTHERPAETGSLSGSVEQQRAWLADQYMMLARFCAGAGYLGEACECYERVCAMCPGTCLAREAMDRMQALCSSMYTGAAKPAVGEEQETPSICPSVDRDAKKLQPDVCQMVVRWHNEVVQTPNSMKVGALTPTLVGRIYLFGDTLGVPLEGDGAVGVELFDLSKVVPPGTEGTPEGGPRRLERWLIDPVKFQQMKQKDMIGYGYNLMLPWGTYRPNLKHLQLRVSYQPARGKPISETSELVLGNEEHKSNCKETPSVCPRARSNEPKKDESNVYDLFGVLKQNSVLDNIKNLESAARMYDDAEALLHQGKTDEACVLYEKIRCLVPGHRFADKAAERLHELQSQRAKPADESPQGKPSPSAGEELMEALGDLVRDCVDAFRWSWAVPYSSDPARRMEQLLKTSEDLRQIEAEWSRFWFTDQPSHMTYDVLRGGIDGDEPPSGNKSDLEKPNKQKCIDELLANFNKAYREGKYKEAYQFASLAHELDPDNAVATTAMLVAKTMIRKQFHEEAQQDGSPSCFVGGSFEKVNESTGKQDESPSASEVLGALGHLCSGCVDAFLGACAGSSCPDEPDSNVPQCSEDDLRQMEAEWRRFWFADQPSHLAYDRIHGEIIEAGVTADKQLSLEDRLKLPVSLNC